VTGKDKPLDVPLGLLDQRAYRNGPRLGLRALDAMMPMHLWVGPTGHILRAGPTFLKLAKGTTVRHRRLTEVLEFRRPNNVHLAKDLIALSGSAIQVQMRDAPRLLLKGIVVALQRKSGFLLNLSPGIRLADVLLEHELRAKDFAPSDLAVEMLYLSEAQTAVLDESRKLNARLQGAKLAAEEQAFTDTLTGLKNRRALEHILDRLSHDDRAREFGLMHVDLDFFKSINDTLGHAAGDRVLQNAARIFAEETRAGDVVARTGGDEFVVIVMDCADPKKLSRIAARIIERLEMPVQFDGQPCRISGSIGITLSHFYDRIDADQMCSDADAALYVSKKQGRARHTFHDPPKNLQ